MARRNLLIPISILIIAFLFGLFQPKFFPSDTKLQPCYHAMVGDSNSLLQITTQNGTDITGDLMFQNYQKDSSYGTFTGKFLDNRLGIDFTFQSEGVESARAITFEKTGKDLISEGFTYNPVKDCKSVLYNQGLGLIPFDMKLPLHLFPQLKLQTISEEQLGWTFGSGGFKPIQSAKMVYTPTKGTPTDAVVFYLWQKSVWNVIANTNEPPDWGVEQWSDQSNVFSVNGPQECGYPNETDCSNISEIYNFIYEKNSYINKVPEYEAAEVKVVKTKTFHDPETGFYVISEFNILGIKAEQSYRCDLTAFDKAGEEIISWKTEGLSFSPRPSTIYSGQTNIKPDQVPTVKSSAVKCKVADAIN
ncbi:MAG: hypothetical protein RL356_288 [Actinomycetota bacterium]